MEEKHEYDEVQYWNFRLDPNPEIPELVTKRHVHYINRHIGSAKSLLDFGPGVGRVFVSYMRVPLIVGCDISFLYSGVVIKMAKKYRLNYHHVITLPTILPFGNREFDVAIACGVLLHQKPQNLITVMAELARVALSVIVISGWDKNNAFTALEDVGPVCEHCFNYDYSAICANQGWQTEDMMEVEGQIYFVYRGK